MEPCCECDGKQSLMDGILLTMSKCMMMEPMYGDMCEGNTTHRWDGSHKVFRL